ncbi:hypothetical protein FRB90_011200 [Tulasnella sp. 427]|nr:hypothetical protein FRB90_011200 [Tulasnella sp. 427]
MGLQVIWPTSLVFCAVLNTLHAGEALIDGLSRLRFFTYATLAAYLYYFLPDNPVVNQLFGTVTGFGMSVLTFDWSQIAAIGSPLMYPFWSQLNIITGFVVFHWIISPTLYYSDVWKTGHLPVSGFGAYDRFAKPYNTSRIFTSDHRFDASAYEEYSPLYLPITFAVTYFLGFMLPGALVVHTALHYGPEALRRLKGASEESDDIHARLMTRYPEAPMWYYWAIVVVCTVMMIVAVDVGDIGVPTWGPLLAMLMTMIYCLPMGYMLAMTGVVPSINVITQVIAGCLFPGSAVANMGRNRPSSAIRQWLHILHPALRCGGWRNPAGSDLAMGQTSPSVKIKIR